MKYICDFREYGFDSVIVNFPKVNLLLEYVGFQSSLLTARGIQTSGVFQTARQMALFLQYRVCQPKETATQMLTPKGVRKQLLSVVLYKSVASEWCGKRKLLRKVCIKCTSAACNLSSH